MLALDAAVALLAEPGFFALACETHTPILGTVTRNWGDGVGT